MRQAELRGRTLSRRTVLALAVAAAGGVVAASTGAFAGVRRGAKAARQRVYLGSYTSSGGGGIGVAGADPETGALTVESWTRAVADPSWLDIAADRRTLYAVTESSPTGRVSALRLDEQGKPALLNGQPTGAGPAHVQVHPQGKHLFVANYDGGSVAVYPIQADGRLGAATDTRKHTPGSGQSSHAHQVVVDPTGRWVLAVDLGLDAVFGYEFDAAKGKLQERSRVRFAARSGPRHLVLHPSGEYAYVTGELNSTVTVCGWRDGTLTPGAVLSTRLKTSGKNSTAEILVSADGRFVYVSNRGDNTVAVFAVSGGGAALRLVATPSCGGDWPRHLAIDPTGRRLYVANERSGDVSWFTLDATTGLPVGPAAKVAAKAVVRILFA